LAWKLLRIAAALHEPFGSGDARGWKFPPLPECRKLWETHFDGEWIWLRDVKEWRR
jgi:hypothetical protein